MIDLNDNSIQSEGSTTRIFNGGNASPGVENCELVRIEKVEGYGAVDFFFADSTGAEIKMREWFVDYTREGADKKEISQAKRMKHILTKFLPEGTALPQAQNSEELLQKVMQALGSSYVGVKVRLKVTYKESGYLQVPPYVPFLELMAIPEASSNLSFSNIDITERPSQDAPEDITAGAAIGNSSAGAVSWP